MGSTCNCIRGEYLCPTAIYLWRQAGIEYKKALQANTPEAWERYDRAREAYDDHFREVENEHTSSQMGV